MLQLPVKGLSEEEKQAQDDLLMAKTKEASYLLYGLNKEHLKNFVCDPANNLLVTHYYNNSEKGELAMPQCRNEALLSLLYFGLHYNSGQKWTHNSL
jgi:hypothetical protein